MHSHLIVLGAGLSGLYSAYLLQQKGYRVTIIEARDRVGGRIDTRVADPGEDLKVEMGAEWIGLKHLRTQQLCKHFHLELANHSLKTHLLYKGKYSKPSQWKFHSEWQAKVAAKIKSFAESSEVEQQALNTIDWWHYLQRCHIPARDLDILDLIESTDYGESIRFTSAFEALSEEILGGGTDSECFYRIAQGNSALPTALAATIGHQHIHLNQEVKSVHQSAEGVSVMADSGKSWQADAVICSLPVPALLAISWQPGFEMAQKEAFWSLNYSRIMKTSLVCSTRFWKQEAFSMITDQLPQYIYHATQNQKGTKGVLTSYSTGERAYTLSRMSDEQRIDEIARALKIPFGDITNKVEKVISYFWTDDAYAKGAYALYEKDLPLAFRTLFRRPFKHVFFCGEHTATNLGFMEGALDSAERVVGEVLQKEK